jgi:cellobiose-specific phosphotransferase system component IIC
MKKKQTIAIMALVYACTSASPLLQAAELTAPSQDMTSRSASVISTDLFLPLEALNEVKSQFAQKQVGETKMAIVDSQPLVTGAIVASHVLRSSTNNQLNANTTASGNPSSNTDHSVIMVLASMGLMLLMALRRHRI